jgi:hypothetical protein
MEGTSMVTNSGGLYNGKGNTNKHEKYPTECISLYVFLYMHTCYVMIVMFIW